MYMEPTLIWGVDLLSRPLATILRLLIPRPPPRPQLRKPVRSLLDMPQLAFFCPNGIIMHVKYILRLYWYLSGCIFRDLGFANTNVLEGCSCPHRA